LLLLEGGAEGRLVLKHDLFTFGLQLSDEVLYGLILNGFFADFLGGARLSELFNVHHYVL
jgi:hypothetical protein